MRCREHPSDSGAGVCALCLQERLSTLSTPLPDHEPNSDFAPPSKPSDLRTTAQESPGNQIQKPTESRTVALKPSSVPNSWLFALILGNWKKKKQKESLAEDVPPVNGRGKSPEMKHKGQRQQSPRRLSYKNCLRPLLRPNHCNRRSHGPPESIFPGDIAGTVNRKWSSVGVAAHEPFSALAPMNRSRKLVDLGKAW